MNKKRPRRERDPFADFHERRVMTILPKTDDGESGSPVSGDTEGTVADVVEVALQEGRRGTKRRRRSRPSVAAVQLASLLDEVAEYLTRFVVFPCREAGDAVALWVAHSHLIDAAESTPRLALLSP